MIFSDLVVTLSKSGTAVQAEKMAKYMQNRFQFWGIA